MPRKNKIDKLIEASEAMQEIEAIDAKTLSFMARILVQATLPHRDPGSFPTAHLFPLSSTPHFFSGSLP